MGIVSGGSGSSPAVLSASLSLTSAQIKQLFTTPIQIVAAQGANALVVPIMAAAKFTYVAPAYTQSAQDALLISYSGYDGLHGQPLQLGNGTGDALDPGILEETSDRVSLADHEAAWDIPAANALNTAMVVLVTGHNPATGNGTLRVTLDYRVVSF